MPLAILAKDTASLTILVDDIALLAILGSVTDTSTYSSVADIGTKAVLGAGSSTVIVPKSYTSSAYSLAVMTTSSLFFRRILTTLNFLPCPELRGVQPGVSCLI